MSGFVQRLCTDFGCRLPLRSNPRHGDRVGSGDAGSDPGLLRVALRGEAVGPGPTRLQPALPADLCQCRAQGHAGKLPLPPNVFGREHGWCKESGPSCSSSWAVLTQAQWPLAISYALLLRRWSYSCACRPWCPSGCSTTCSGSLAYPRCPLSCAAGWECCPVRMHNVALLSLFLNLNPASLLMRVLKHILPACHK